MARIGGRIGAFHASLPESSYRWVRVGPLDVLVDETEATFNKTNLRSRALRPCSCGVYVSLLHFHSVASVDPRYYLHSSLFLLSVFDSEQSGDDGACASFDASLSAVERERAVSLWRPLLDADDPSYTGRVRYKNCLIDHARSYEFRTGSFEPRSIAYAGVVLSLDPFGWFDAAALCRSHGRDFGESCAFSTVFARICEYVETRHLWTCVPFYNRTVSDVSCWYCHPVLLPFVLSRVSPAFFTRGARLCLDHYFGDTGLLERLSLPSDEPYGLASRIARDFRVDCRSGSGSAYVSAGAP